MAKPIWFTRYGLNVLATPTNSRISRKGRFIHVLLFPGNDEGLNSEVLYWCIRELKGSMEGLR